MYNRLFGSLIGYIQTMDKNPISFLQEYLMSKMKTLPNYTVIKQQTGTHINSFTIRVDCDNYTAEGIGASKKEAKVNAANKMLDLLNINERKSRSPAQNLQTNVSNSSNNIKDDVQCLLLQKSQLTPTINYVGKVQEIAAGQGSLLPVYVCKDITGPSHGPIFTMTCKYRDLEVEARGSSKKEAKTLVAKKMYERISAETEVVVPQAEINSYLKTITDGMVNLMHYDLNKGLMKESAGKAKQQFSKLSKTTIDKTSLKGDQESFAGCYTLFRDKYSRREREMVVDKLEDTMNACKSYLSLDDKIINPITFLKKALNVLDVTVEIVNYDAKKNCAIYGLQLKTNPVISEIGYGRNKKEAEITAVFQMAKTLIMLL